MRMRISSDMDFYIDLDIQESKGNQESMSYDAVYAMLLKKIKTAFPEGSVTVHSFEICKARDASSFSEHDYGSDILMQEVRQ